MCDYNLRILEDCRYAILHITSSYTSLRKLVFIFDISGSMFKKNGNYRPINLIYESIECFGQYFELNKVQNSITTILFSSDSHIYKNFDIPTRDEIKKLAHGTNFTNLLYKLIDMMKESCIIHIFSDGFDNSELSETLVSELNDKIITTNTSLYTFGTGTVINTELLCSLNRHSPNCQRIDIRNITVNLESFLKKTNESKQYIDIEFANHVYNNVEVINNCAVIELLDCNGVNEQTDDPQINQLIETYITQKCIKDVIACKHEHIAIDITLDEPIIMDFIDINQYKILEDCIYGIGINENVDSVDICQKTGLQLKSMHLNNNIMRKGRIYEEMYELTKNVSVNSIMNKFSNIDTFKNEMQCVVSRTSVTDLVNKFSK